MKNVIEKGSVRYKQAKHVGDGDLILVGDRFYVVDDVEVETHEESGEPLYIFWIEETDEVNCLNEFKSEPYEPDEWIVYAGHLGDLRFLIDYDKMEQGIKELQESLINKN